MTKIHVFLIVIFAVNIGINIMSGNLAAICGWFAALMTQIQICTLDWK